MITNNFRLGLYVLLLAAMCTAGCDVAFVTYEITDGYTGWVVVEFEEASCELNSERYRSVTIHIDGSGKGCTSFPRVLGTEFFYHYYVGEDGRRLQELKRTGWGEGGYIWAATAPYESRYRVFFVGPESALETSWSEQPMPKPEK